jgi:hypothetical protein
MNSHSLESSYITLCNDLELQVKELNSNWSAVGGFWERWCSEHRSVMQKLTAVEGADSVTGSQELLGSEFLIRRKRMISALVQGASRAPLKQEWRNALAKLVADHDRGFIQLLQLEMEHVRVQMHHAFAVKKTVSAYANSAQFRGE